MRLYDHESSEIKVPRDCILGEIVNIKCWQKYRHVLGAGIFFSKELPS